MLKRKIKKLDFYFSSKVGGTKNLQKKDIIFKGATHKKSNPNSLKISVKIKAKKRPIRLKKKFIVSCKGIENDRD